MHVDHGRGIVVEKWGSWFTCRECNAETGPPTRSLCPFCDKAELSKPIATSTMTFRCLACENLVRRPSIGFCPNCEKDRLLVNVSGTSICDVRFGREIISVHELYLDCLVRAPELAPTEVKPKKLRGPRGRYKRRNYNQEYLEKKKEEEAA